MRIFYDTEFIVRGHDHPLVLISLAMVTESDDGPEILVVNSEFDDTIVGPWVREHVIPRLPSRASGAWMPPDRIAAAVRCFVGSESPELWGDFAAYDHVLLAQLLGTMEAWPSGWPMFTMDVQQWRVMAGVQAWPANLAEDWPGPAHDALADARLVRARWRYLRELAAG